MIGPCVSRLDIPTFVRRSTAIWIIDILADFNRRVRSGELYWR